MIAVRLPKDIESRLENLAKKTGRTKSFYVREALQEYLDELEDMYIAHSRIKSLKKTVPLDKLINE